MLRKLINYFIMKSSTYQELQDIIEELEEEINEQDSYIDELEDSIEYKNDYIDDLKLDIEMYKDMYNDLKDYCNDTLKEA